jgi:hypothetical protein
LARAADASRAAARTDDTLNSILIGRQPLAEAEMELRLARAPEAASRQIRHDNTEVVAIETPLAKRIASMRSERWESFLLATPKLLAIAAAPLALKTCARPTIDRHDRRVHGGKQWSGPAYRSFLLRYSPVGRRPLKQ